MELAAAFPQGLQYILVIEGLAQQRFPLEVRVLAQEARVQGHYQRQDAPVALLARDREQHHYVVHTGRAQQCCRWERLRRVEAGGGREAWPTGLVGAHDFQFGGVVGSRQRGGGAPDDAVTRAVIVVVPAGDLAGLGMRNGLLDRYFP